MSKTTQLVSAILISTGLFAHSVLADQGQFYIAPGIQWMEFDDTTPLDEDVSYFFGLGYDFTDRLSVELSTFDLKPDTGAGPHIDLDHYKLDMLYTLGPIDRFVSTFVVSGLGNTNFQGENESLWDLGAGVSLKLNDRLSWRTAVRSYKYRDRDFEDGDVGIDSALVYRFGGSRAARPVAATPAAAPPARPPAAAPPADPDSDQDGVPDSRDNCANTPRNYAVDANGCPIPVEEVARIELEVHFDFDQSVVKPEFFSEIEELAQFMRQYSDVVVELEGHTDSVGTEAYNLGLSTRRANAVRAVLLDRFSIAGNRVTALGFGESRPAASNDTDAGRAQNRRVITVVVKTLQNYRPR